MQTRMGGLTDFYGVAYRVRESGASMGHRDAGGFAVRIGASSYLFAGVQVIHEG